MNFRVGGGRPIAGQLIDLMTAQPQAYAILTGGRDVVNGDDVVLPFAEPATPMDDQMRDAMRLRVDQQMVNRTYPIAVSCVDGQAAPDQNFLLADPEPHPVEDRRRMERMDGTVWANPDARVGGRMTTDGPSRGVWSPKLHL